MDTSQPNRLTGPQHEAAEGLHLCPWCRSELVQPTTWFEQSGGRWQVELRCPDCEWVGEGSFKQETVDRFDQELDRGAEMVMKDLRALTRANMSDEADRLAAALATDSILPEDF